jgi:hypothetical protein
LDVAGRCRRFGGVEGRVALRHVADQLHVVLLVLHQFHALLDDASRLFMRERQAGKGGEGGNRNETRDTRLRLVRTEALVEIIDPPSQ